MNMDLLALQTSSKKAKRVFATAKGISKSDQIIITTNILNMLARKPQNLEVHIAGDTECRALFDQYRRSLSGN